MLQSKRDGIFDARWKGRDDLAQRNFFSSRSQEECKIDISCEARLTPALDGDPTDDGVGNVASAEEDVKLPGGFKL